MTPSEVDETLSAFDAAVARVRANENAEDHAAALYEAMTEDERLKLLSGDEPFWPGMKRFMTEGYNLSPYIMGAVARLGVPGIRFVDGPRGVVSGHGTAFPVSMARGATWDTDLEEEVGRVIGREVRAIGGNFFGGVCINLPRHPAWGRSQETYSDNPVLLGAMGAALTNGVQENAMACVKHYALNSMENGRFTVDVTASEEVLHEDFLAHFEHTVRDGVMAVMSSYNSVNGVWAGQNKELLTTVLRDQWGFEGLVISDFIWGHRDPAMSVNAGLDLEAPFAQQREEALRDALTVGTTSWAMVRRAAMRILATQLKLYASRSETEPGLELMASQDHVELAREVARRSMVLLKNESVDGAPVLPLDGKVGRLGIFGRLIDAENTGDHGSSDVRAPYVVTPLQGIRDAFPESDVVHSTGEDPSELDASASGCDAAIVIVGYDASDEGEFLEGSLFSRPDLSALYPEPANDEERAIRDEILGAVAEGASVVGSETAGGDRQSLRLRDDDVAVIRAVAKQCPRTVVCIVSAGGIVMREWVDDVPGVMQIWYSGMEGGKALGDILTGEFNPTGRLPYAVAMDETDLPELDIDATAITYDRWYGQRLIDKRGSRAEFPLGFGLSYTTFELGDIAVEHAGKGLSVSVAVSNTGDRDGGHVVQLYGTRLDGDRAGERELIGFRTANIAAGQTDRITIVADLAPLKRWNGTALELPAGRVRVEAASFSGDPHAVSVETDF